MHSGTAEPQFARSRSAAPAAAWTFYALSIVAFATFGAACSHHSLEPVVTQAPYYRWINDEPEWSPSGRYILYNHYPQTDVELANGVFQIWSLDLATGATQFRAAGSNAQWMDSDAAFTFSTSGIYRFDLASSQEALLLACGGAAQTSPDGRLLAMIGSCSFPTTVRPNSLSMTMSGAATSSA